MTCKNPKCGDRLAPWERRIPLCASCRYAGRWAFAAGAGLVGAVWGVIQLFR